MSGFIPVLGQLAATNRLDLSLVQLTNSKETLFLRVENTNTHFFVVHQVLPRVTYCESSVHITTDLPLEYL